MRGCRVRIKEVHSRIIRDTLYLRYHSSTVIDVNIDVHLCIDVLAYFPLSH